MTELPPEEPSSSPAAATLPPPSPPPPPPNDLSPRRFDPSRTIGIIRRKALIKDLAAVYHAECLSYCQELLEIQRKCEEPYTDIKVSADLRKETMRASKRHKKSS